MISTSCHNCRFIIKDDKGDQTGCQADILKRFLDEGKAELETIEDTKSYKTTNCFCPMFRPADWMADLDHQQAVAEARRERTLAVASLVSCEKGELSDVARTAEMLEQQKLKPTEVVFVITARSKVKPKDVLATLRDLDLSYQYSLRFVMDSSYTELDALQEGVGNNLKSVFILFVEAGQPLENCYLADLDYLINDQNQRVVLVDPGKIHGMLVQTMAFNMVGGFHEVVWEETEEKIASVAEKLKRIAKSQNSQYLILDGELPHVA